MPQGFQSNYSQQDISTLLSNLGLGSTSFGGLSNLSQYDIQGALENQFGVQGMFSPGMFGTIDPSTLAATTSKDYTRQTETLMNPFIG